MSRSRADWLQRLTNLSLLVASIVAAFVLIRGEIRRVIGSVRVDRISTPAALDSAGLTLVQGAATPTVYVFSDFQCPYCNGYRGVVDSAVVALSDTPRVRIVHLPLPGHPRAVDAAILAECASGVGALRVVYDGLFDRQRGLVDLDFDSFAAEIGVDHLLDWSRCREDSTARLRLRQDSIAVAALRVSETPTVIVGEWRFRYPPSASELGAAVQRVRDGRRPRGAEWTFPFGQRR